MKKYGELLHNIPLFEGIKPEEYTALLACVGAYDKKYTKGDFIFLSGDAIEDIGVVLAGRVHMIKEDVFGNRAILNDLATGGIFGESFICGGEFSLTVSIVAAQPSHILFLPFERVLHSCSNACGFHAALVKNMVVMMARKNIKLIEKLDVTTRRSLQEKVLTYLSQLAQQQKSSTVVSALGRTDLADFLGVDRSALTRELNRMQEEGMLQYEKNTYYLKGTLLE